MKITIATFIIFVACIPVGAAGDFDQLPPGKWWENPQVVEKLTLSAEQKQQINSHVYDHAMRMIDLKAALERAELALRDRADQPDFDADAVRAAFAEFQRARQNLETERFEMLLSVRQVLTSSQWQELRQLRQQFERRHGGMRFQPDDRPHRGGMGRMQEIPEEAPEKPPQGPPL